MPIPIGVGPRYHPAPGARHDAGLLCTPSGKRYGVHLELFAHRRVVIVPAGIGVPRRYCTYSLRTRTPTGVIEVAPGTHVTLGRLFDLWGQPLSHNRLAGFSGAVSAFVGGKHWLGDPRAIPLRRHAQIVLELGGYIPPHPSYLFPAGL